VPTQRTVYYSGQVQGVGFRFTTCRIARGFDVVGFVKNLPDGRVQVVAEGEPEELDRFIGAIKAEMHMLVQGVQANDAPATGRFTRFDVGF